MSQQDNNEQSEKTAVPGNQSGQQQTNTDGATGNNQVAGSIGTLNQYFGPQDPVSTLTEYSKKMLFYGKAEFVETSHYTKARDCLQDQGCVTLTGGPGDGKTAMAARLLRLHHQQGANVVALRDPNQLHQLLHHPARSQGTTLVLVDDIFGTFAPNSPHMTSWREALQEADLCLQSQKSSPCQHHFNFIFTTRQMQAQEARAGLGSLSVSLFHDKRLVNLGSLDKADKRHIFLHHAKLCTKEKLFTDKQVDHIASLSPPYGFPHICQLFFQNLSVEVKAERFFSDPLNYVSKFLKQILNDQPAQALLLACMVLCDGRLDSDLLTGESGHSASSNGAVGGDQTRPKSVLHTLVSMLSPMSRRPTNKQDVSLLQRALALVPCGENARSITAQEVLESSEVMKGSYVCQEGNSLVFTHPVFQDTVCSLLGKFRPELVVRHCSLLFLYERVTFKESSEVMHGSVCLKPHHRSLLLDRFVQELTSGHFFLVCIHPALAESGMAEELVTKLRKGKVLDTVLKTQDKDSYGSLLLCAVHSQSSELFETLWKEKKQIVHNESFVIDVITQCCLSDNVGCFKVLERKITRNCLKVSDTLQAETGGIGSFLKNFVSVSSKYKVKTSNFSSCQSGSRVEKIGQDVQEEKFEGINLRVFDEHEYCQTTLSLAVLHGANRVVEQLLSLTSAMLTDCQLRDAFVMACLADNAPALVTINSHTGLLSRLQIPLFILPSQFGAAEVARSVLSELRKSGVEGRELQEKVRARDEAGWTPLMIAANYGEVEVVKVLQPSVETSEGESSCVISNTTAKSSEDRISRNDVDVVSLLLPLSDAKATTNDGWTAMMFASQNGHAAVVSLLLPESDARATNTYGWTAMMYASAKGHAAVVSLLLPESDAKATTNKGHTAIMPASHAGHADVVELLLSVSDATATDTDGRTAMMYASANGHAAVVELLLPVSDAKAADTAGKTALMHASQNGHAAVVKLLLPVSDAKITNTNGVTALMLASQKGHDAVVKLLLPASDAKATNTNKVTPLMLASQNGHAAIVELLLPVSDAKATTHEGHTALVLASQKGHAAVVKLLLPVSDAKATNTNKVTPLMLASQNGHAAVVSLLLPVSDAKATAKLGLTALMLASQNGHAAVVKLLLPVSDAKATNTNDWTALMLASKNGHAAVVSWLLPVSDAMATNNKRNTALMLASQNGHAAVVSLLLPECDAKATDTDGWTALMYASKNGHAPVVKLLLPESDAKAANTDGVTALMLASQNGYDAVVSLLLPVSDAKATDTRGGTAMSIASYNGHAAVVKLLLPVSDAKATNTDSWTALMHSSGNGHADVVSLLLPVSDAKANNTHGWTALMLASQNGHAAVVKLLLPVSDANATNTEGVTALMLASVHGHTDVVSLLLPVSDAKANDTNKITALMLASYNGHADIVSRLLPHSNAAAADNSGKTALHLASDRGHRDIVELLSHL